MSSTQRIIGIILVIVAVVLVVMNVVNRSNKNDVPQEPIVQTPAPIASQQLCFYSSVPSERGFPDIAWIRMNLAGDNTVTGEFKNLPSGIDSKIGTFSGVVSIDANGISKADTWWDSMAEGMNIREQLIMNYDNDSVRVAFAEKVDRGDGVYVYKDMQTISTYKTIPHVSCYWMNAKLSVEDYVRANIKTLAPQPAVLGGIMYVVRVSADPATSTGSVTYEDGHMQYTSSFTFMLGTHGLVSSVALVKK